jgi:hypothetical protein
MAMVLIQKEQPTTLVVILAPGSRCAQGQENKSQDWADEQFNRIEIFVSHVADLQPTADAAVKARTIATTPNTISARNTALARQSWTSRNHSKRARKPQTCNATKGRTITRMKTAPQLTGTSPD